MTQAKPLVQNISDTALWSAVYRARETEREDALFRDHLALRLSGARGEQIAEGLKVGKTDAAFGAIRTYLYDQFITESVRQGFDMVVSLAAGLDASPYRLDLPSTLQWVEVDLPALIDYKTKILQGEQPRCQLERLKLDLSAESERRKVFGELATRAKKILIVTEGLLMYLRPEEVATLARDLAAPATFQRWALDLMSPGLLNLVQKKTGKNLADAGAPLKFGPREGPGFFAPYGWTAPDVRSLMKTGARLQRLPLPMRLLAMLPESKGAQGSRPWAGVCLLTKKN